MISDAERQRREQDPDLPLNDGADRGLFRCPRDGTEWEVEGRARGERPAFSFEPAWGAETLACPECGSAYRVEVLEVNGEER